MTPEHKFQQANRIFTFALIALTLSCKQYAYQGSSVPSSDRQTYLVVDEAENTEIIQVDGKPWPYPIRTPGSISPGVHRIRCGHKIGWEFNTRNGETLHLTYHETLSLPFLN